MRSSKDKPSDLTEGIISVHVAPSQQVLLLLQLHVLCFHLHINGSLHIISWWVRVLQFCCEPTAMRNGMNVSRPGCSSL